MTDKQEEEFAIIESRIENMLRLVEDLISISEESKRIISESNKLIEGKE